MNYATIKWTDIANGVGVRISLFVSGCTHRCKNCFNEIAWDFHYGEPFDEAVKAKIIHELQSPFLAGLSLLGGEPLEPQNQEALYPFIKRVREMYPKKTVWCYTGFLFEDILGGKVGDPETARALLGELDVLVDGPFVERLKDLSLRFRGSSNQRILDVRLSITSGTSVIMEGTWERRMGSGNIEESL